MQQFSLLELKSHAHKLTCTVYGLLIALIRTYDKVRLIQNTVIQGIHVVNFVEKLPHSN